MFESGLGSLLWSLVLNILVPLVPGVVFVRIFFGTKLQGILLYIVGRFIGIGVVAHWLFNLQFFRLGIGIGEYAVLIVLLIAGWVWRMQRTKTSITEYLGLLRCSVDWTGMRTSWVESNLWIKGLTLGAIVSVIWFLIISFSFTTNFPTYADDSFGNRNRPILNILQDDGVKLFGERDEILARGRLGYPIHIPLYKALISTFQGGYNDIFTDLMQRLAVVGLFIFLITITRQHTRRLFFSVLPGALIISLPLVFLHSVESYHDMLVAIYAVLACYFVRKFLQEKENKYIALAVLICFIMTYVKVEGLIIYLSSLLISLFTLLLIRGELGTFVKDIRTEKHTLYKMMFYTMFMFLPFQIVRTYHHLGFNPTGLETGEVMDSQIHREIFDYFAPIFFQLDNYGPVLIFVILLSFYVIRKTRKSSDDINIFFLIYFLSVFALFTLVFLLTDNYQRVLDQTTVNRVYTMAFLVFFSFGGVIAYEYPKNKKN